MERDRNEELKNRLKESLKKSRPGVKIQEESANFIHIDVSGDDEEDRRNDILVKVFMAMGMSEIKARTKILEIELERGFDIVGIMMGHYQKRLDVIDKHLGIDSKGKCSKCEREKEEKNENENENENEDEGEGQELNKTK